MRVTEFNEKADGSVEMNVQMTSEDKRVIIEQALESLVLDIQDTVEETGVVTEYSKLDTEDLLAGLLNALAQSHGSIRQAIDNIHHIVKPLMTEGDDTADFFHHLYRWYTLYFKHQDADILEDVSKG